MVLVILGEKREFSLFHRSLDFTGRSAAPLMGRRQVALQETNILQSLFSEGKINRFDSCTINW